LGFKRGGIEEENAFGVDLLHALKGLKVDHGSRFTTFILITSCSVNRLPTHPTPFVQWWTMGWAFSPLPPAAESRPSVVLRDPGMWGHVHTLSPLRGFPTLSFPSFFLNFYLIWGFKGGGGLPP